MIGSCIVKVPVWIVLSGGQNCSFTPYNVYTVCLALFLLTFAILCTDSVDLGLKLINAII